MPTTHLYLIRHGQSEANLPGCFLGHGERLTMAAYSTDHFIGGPVTALPDSV